MGRPSRSSRRVAPAPPASSLHWIDVLKNAYMDVVATRSPDPLARLAKMLVDPPPLWLGFDKWSDSAAAYVKEHELEERIYDSLDKAGIVPNVPQPDDVLERLSTQLLSMTTAAEQPHQHPWKLSKTAARQPPPQETSATAAPAAAKSSAVRKPSKGQPAPAKILVHMDPGQDLDDEMFLVLLAALTRRRLVKCIGVVATLKPAEMRAKLARGTLDELGLRGVPVGVGSDGGSEGKNDFSDVSYLRPPGKGHDGESLMLEVLKAADPGSVTLVIVASLKDAASLLRREEVLFKNKIKAVVIQGGVKPLEGEFLEPDTAHNNEFDKDASAFFYKRCQELEVPLTVVSRFTANACQMPRSIYDKMAEKDAQGRESQIGVRLQKSQAISIEQLWRRANATGDERQGLPARCTPEWFCNTFCAGKGMERDGSQSIWDLIVGFNVYDPIALVAAVPSLARRFFTFEEVEVSGVRHSLAGTTKEQTGLKSASELQDFLVDAFIDGIKPNRSQKQVDGDASVEALREALSAEQKQTQDLRAEVIRLRALASAKGKAS